MAAGLAASIEGSMAASIGKKSQDNDTYESADDEDKS